MKFHKTNLGEGLVVCDKCMRMARRHEVIEIRSPLSSAIIHEHKRDCGNADGK